MAVPVSTSTPYCSNAQFMILHDYRNVADLLVDDDSRLTQALVLASTNLTKFLSVASGEIESALLACNRYTPTDLAALTGASSDYLQQLTADLAFWRMCSRRWPEADPKDVQGASAALGALERLRKGENIFGLQEIMNAGLAETVNVWAEPPPWRVSVEANRFFGFRSGPWGGCE